MQNNNTFNQVDSYPDPLEIINGIKFTPKEIELISCMLSGKSAKIIASFLSRSPKNIESHTRNIMKKLECNSRSGIIDFIEKSDKFTRLKEYYLDLLIQNSFKKTLQEIEKIIRPEVFECHIVYWPELEDKTSYAHQLAHYLKLAGIKSFIEARKGCEFFNDDIDAQKFPRTNIIYLIPETLVTQLSEGSEINQSNSLTFVKASSQNGGKSIFLVSEEKAKIMLSQRFDKVECVDFLEQENDYFAVFEIFKKLFSTLPVEKAVRDFKEQYKKLKVSTELNNPSAYLKDEEFIKHKNNLSNLRYFHSKWSTLFLLILICISYVGFSFLKRAQHEGPAIRSDLIIPTEAVFIDRPEFTSQIDNLFKSKNDIQTIALVGPGGVGKTTLARQYAHNQKANVIWEINAETDESLRVSFESLAEALATTEEDKKVLRSIQEIKNTTKKQEKIIQFVKNQLHSHPDWFLIIDNVEQFTGIQNFFPQDAATWGKGKIIFTTRDSNIQNNERINGIIQVGELSLPQKLNLFEKIVILKTKRSFDPAETEEVKAFLEHIPSFPLDVSVAAYYVKATNIPYDTYLKNLVEQNNDFESVEKNLLKEAGSYTKTRYGIIALSLQRIMQIDKDFRDLLILLSLLDSQNIPRDLLNTYKTSTIVDNFIYNLKRHSLITSEVSNMGSAFSIHRSTQAITLSYLVKLLNLEKNKSLIEHVGKTFKNHLSEVLDKENFSKMNSLTSHCEAFLKHTPLLTNFTIASISGELGSIYKDLGQYEKAKHFLEQSLNIFKKSHYKNHPWFARNLTWLGSVYREENNYEKAKLFLEQGLLIFRSNNYDNHPWFARNLTWLGSLQRDLGNYEKAKQLFEQGLDIYRKNSYENHPWFARTLAWLGSVYREEGNYEKAKQFYEQAIVVYRKNSYENHPWFAWTLAWSGCAYRDLGNYEKAQQLLEQSLEIYRKNSYENHPWFVRTLAWLGSVYREEGNFENAKQFLEQSLAICKKNSLENNPCFIPTLIGLGNVYKDLGNYEKAKDLLQHSLQIYKKIYDKNHIEIARILRSMGQNYLLTGDVKTAEKYLFETLDIFHKNKHPDIYLVLEDLADLYLKKSNFEKSKGAAKQAQDFNDRAISFLKQAVAVVEANFPKDSPHIKRLEAKLKKVENDVGYLTKE